MKSDLIRFRTAGLIEDAAIDADPDPTNGTELGGQEPGPEPLGCLITPGLRTGVPKRLTLLPIRCPIGIFGKHGI
jgi:hypothetical protein